MCGFVALCTRISRTFTRRQMKNSVSLLMQLLWWTRAKPFYNHRNALSLRSFHLNCLVKTNYNLHYVIDKLCWLVLVVVVHKIQTSAERHTQFTHILCVNSFGMWKCRHILTRALMKSSRAIYCVILDLDHIFCELPNQAKNKINRVNKLESIKIGVVKAVKAHRLNTLSQ